MAQIILTLVLLCIVFLHRNKITLHKESKKEWLIFFLLFLIITIAYSADLVNNFSYIKLAILALIFVPGLIAFYKRFKNIDVR